MFKLKPSLAVLFHSSLKSIFKNKVRTFLTCLGIIIGVTSVILMLSIGSGLKTYINQQFEVLGSNTIYIYPGRVFTQTGGINREGGQTSLTFSSKDLVLLKHRLKNVNYVVPMSQASVSVKVGQNIQEATLIVTSHQYASARNQHPSAENGRFFTKQEEVKNSKVVVLGSKIAKDLFPQGKPLGRQIIVSGKRLKVIGIMDKLGSTGSLRYDNYLYVPLSIGQDIIGNQNIMTIIISVNSKDNIESVKKQTEELMLTRYQEDTFSVIDQSQILTSINNILSTLTLALSGIAAISLVVGGIGIMNIMLVSVTERTKEIGLRKAVGAYPSAILLQFLFEAVILSAFGGIIGIILGAIGTYIINRFFPAQITPQSILLAVGVSSLVGTIFGVAPARRAAKLNPIAALRYE